MKKSLLIFLIFWNFIVHPVQGFVDEDDTTFRPGTTIRKYARQEHKSNLVWTEGYSSGSESLTYDPLSLANIRVNRGRGCGIWRSGRSGSSKITNWESDAICKAL